MSTPAAKFCEFFVRRAAVSGQFRPVPLAPASAGRGVQQAARAGSRAAKRVLAPRPVWKVLTKPVLRLQGPFWPFLRVF